jgi:hypothetical protein
VSEGEQELREALAMRKASLPEGHFFIAMAEGALGECLMIQRRYAEAEPLLKESESMLMRSQGELNPKTVHARVRLERLLDEQKAGRSPR